MKENTEGEYYRNKLKSTGTDMAEIAQMLKLTPQGLNYHLRKEILSDDFKRLVKEVFPNLFQVENMLNEPEVEYRKSTKPIPYYDIDVTAGNMEIFKGDSTEKPADYFYIPGFSDCTACVNVRGDSMYSKYCAGDIIAIKLIEDTDVIQYGEAYVITTKEQNLFKYIRRAADIDSWLLESEYKERYDAFPIKKEKVINIFLVRGVVRAKTM